MTIRTMMWDAGIRCGVKPLRLSFKGAIQTLLSLWPVARDLPADKLAPFYDALLHAIACRKIAHRPNRSEPRVVKRRPKTYDRMNEPRAVLKARLIEKPLSS